MTTFGNLKGGKKAKRSNLSRRVTAMAENKTFLTSNLGYNPYCIHAVGSFMLQIYSWKSTNMVDYSLASHAQTLWIKF